MKKANNIKGLQIKICGNMDKYLQSDGRKIYNKDKLIGYRIKNGIVLRLDRLSSSERFWYLNDDFAQELFEIAHRERYVISNQAVVYDDVEPIKNGWYAEIVVDRNYKKIKSFLTWNDIRKHRKLPLYFLSSWVTLRMKSKQHSTSDILSMDIVHSMVDKVVDENKYYISCFISGSCKGEKVRDELNFQYEKIMNRVGDLYYEK